MPITVSKAAEMWKWFLKRKKKRKCFFLLIYVSTQNFLPAKYHDLLKFVGGGEGDAFRFSCAASIQVVLNVNDKWEKKKKHLHKHG